MERKRKKITTVMALIASILIVAISLVGCSSCFGGSTTIPVSGIEFSTDAIALEVGDTISVGDYVSIAPADATDKSYTLKSDHESIARISGKQLMGVSIGDAIITVFYGDKYSDTMTVSVVGVGMSTAPRVVYNNVYPHIYVNYNDPGDNAIVEIAAPDGKVSTYSTQANASMFDGDVFDAKDAISLCADNQQTYQIRVKTSEDGDLNNGTYTQKVPLKQLPSAAKAYLETKVVDQDLYFINDEEFYIVFEYYCLFREKIANAPIKFSGYMGYSSDYVTSAGNASNLFDNAFGAGATAGNYSYSVPTVKSNIISVSMRTESINSPTSQTAIGANSATKAMNANLPHINYDETKYRDKNYQFAIDKVQESWSVTYSDELYFTASRGLKPVPTVGSPAETLYAFAKDLLRKIVTDDMTDVEKAHAIYDWIMYHNTYDTASTKLSDDTTSYAVFYLESILTDGASGLKDKNGDYYRPNGVCDGISKAYTLLCNMEGIPCVRISGAYDEGGHAWNKVYINNAWYLVDATFGDTTADNYELATHSYFLLSKNEIDSLRVENYSQELRKGLPSYYPECTQIPYHYMDSYTLALDLSKTTFDCYINSTDGTVSEFETLIQNFITVANKIDASKSLVVPYCPPIIIDKIGIELIYESSSTATLSKIYGNFRTAYSNLERSGKIPNNFLYDMYEAYTMMYLAV